MPPKAKFTREELIGAALELIRESGPDGATARGVAARLNATPKVIFGLFTSMDELRQEALRAVWQLYWKRTKADMDSGRYPPYKASGMAYIRFAGEEPELFRLLFMGRDSPAEPDGETEAIFDLIARTNGISREQAKLLHLEMWIFVHGAAVLSATGRYPLDEELLSAMLTDVYRGLLARIQQEEQT